MSWEGNDIGPDEDRPGHASTPEETVNSTLESLSLSNCNDLEEDCFPATMISNTPVLAEPLDFSSYPTPRDLLRFASQQRRPPPNYYYLSEANRLESFRDWPERAHVCKDDLARNGFIFTGTSDKVRCSFCNGTMLHWQPGDIVEVEHRQAFPRCPFVLGEDVGNIPLEQTANGLEVHTGYGVVNRHLHGNDHGRSVVPSGVQCGEATNFQRQPAGNSEKHHFSGISNGPYPVRNGLHSTHENRMYMSKPSRPQMAAEPDRLATFETWPAQMRQRPETLAAAGLYYSGDGDKVRCFYCDGLLYNWEPEDDPWTEHAKWFPSCQYVRLVKGDSFVEAAQNRSDSQDLMQTPSVLAVLSEGFTPEIVRRAIDVLKNNEGANAVVTGEKLLRQVMELESENKVHMKVNGHVSADVQQLMEENESLKDKQLCKICMERDVEVIFYPCRHLVCCATCGAAVTTCPVCRHQIESVDKVFLA
ncbi:baculoviral IAP repeat-containing protein 7-like [Pomacea canaliculata]|uniref:baculoviral IAP repeat-containing protein 7-like n=1 Tax=Pomacea canaliculata TaxID=400727 RepID=UPI000D72B642|nr:baculoviral IAP repeat-containing protein 7-like [Pomacea canaliculata]XP_025097689.1 baculoviral IAP repeat-containing protein 7-like [Pomacea canaliculata]